MLNYAQNPIPQVPASQFNALGGLTFPGVGGVSRNLWNYYKKQFMPRFGLAYSITPKTVIRTGYGIYFQQLGIVNVGGSGAGGGGGGVLNQAGFGATTSFVGSTDNGQTYVANLTNPFPGGFVAPTGSSAGFSTFQGQNISFYPKSMRNPYMQRWQFALQQQLPFTSLIEVSYVGNRSTRLLATQDFDAIPRQYLSTLPTRDQATINLLGAQVANPFYPLLPRTNLAATTVATSQLLRPNPQFSGITALENAGFSWFHSFQGRIEKRFSRGLAAQYSFTWAKWMQATSYLNATDRIPEKVISDLDRPFRHVLTAIYELPFGPHKYLLEFREQGHRAPGWRLAGAGRLHAPNRRGAGLWKRPPEPRDDNGQRSVARGPAQCHAMVQRERLQPGLQPATRVQHSVAVVRFQRGSRAACEQLGLFGDQERRNHGAGAVSVHRGVY